MQAQASSEAGKAWTLGEGRLTRLSMDTCDVGMWRLSDK